MSKTKSVISEFIFFSRWLQAPLYIGLVFALAVYVYRYAIELYHLISHVHNLSDNDIMLGVLNLIDVVMIANLLIMVIVGGYETFVSHLRLKSNSDRPEWLDQVNAGSMKIKLALALIGISSIHLLRTFIDPSKQTNDSIMWQVIIHATLLASALSIAYANILIAKDDH